MADGLKYDDLPDQVRKDIEAQYPGREEREPGRMPDGTPDWNDPRNWMTEEEMDELGITDSTPRSVWEPMVQRLPARKLPVPIQQRDVKGPRMMLGGPMDAERGTRSMNEWVDETEMTRTINKEREDYYREQKGLSPIPEMDLPDDPNNRRVELEEQLYGQTENLTRLQYAEQTGHWSVYNKRPPVNEEVLRDGATNIFDAALMLAMPTEADPTGSEEPNTEDQGASQIDKMVPNYKPGNRESENVEDRREFATMKAKPLEPLKTDTKRKGP